MKLFFASGNKHKQQEIAQIFAPHTVLIPSDCGIEFEPEETGATFIENSLIKAKALWDIVREPVLADDSGICVDLLGGAPGVYSARYAGMANPRGTGGGKLDAPKRNALLLEHAACALRDFRRKHPESAANDGELRACRFVCAMVLYLGNERYYAVQETLEGNLVAHLDDAAGANGFGYDPVVFLPELGKTVAELSGEQKNALSHRGKAGRKLAGLLGE